MSRIEANSKPPSYEILKDSPPGNILRTYLDAARHVERFQNSVHFTLEGETLYDHAVAVPVFIWEATNRFPNLARAVDVPKAIIMGVGHDIGELFATHDVALSDPAHHDPTLEGRRKRKESRSFGYIIKNQAEPLKTQLNEQYYRYQLSDEESPNDTTRGLVKLADKYTDVRVIRNKAKFYSPVVKSSGC